MRCGPGLSNSRYKKIWKIEPGNQKRPSREHGSKSVREPYKRLQWPRHMQISRKLTGRTERRLPIIIAVRLLRVGDLRASEEVTYTHNVSVGGARVVSTRSWEVGEQGHIAPLKEEPSLRGEVVYCQSLGNDRFCVGFKFRELVTWSALSRYNGT